MLGQCLVTFYHISFPDRRKEKRAFTFIGEETEEVSKAGDPYLVGATPDEEVGKGKFGYGGWKSFKKGIKDRSFFKG
jgi:hypothetical protein